MVTKIRKIGNSLGVTLPKTLLDELNLKEGDKISIQQQGDDLLFKPVDPDFEEWAEAYRRANTDFRSVLNELSK